MVGDDRAPATHGAAVGPSHREDGVHALLLAVSTEDPGEPLLIDPHIGYDLVLVLPQEVAPGPEDRADVHGGGLVGEVVVLKA